jgi:lysozyme
MNTFSQTALAMLAVLEGCRLEAYQDSGGVWTIGYGHTGPEVVEGLTWTQAQADAQMVADLAATEAHVTGLLVDADGNPIQLGDNQYSEFVVLNYNIGDAAFASSSALGLVRSGVLVGIPAHIRLWNEVPDGNGGRVVSPGLVGRRWAECALWRTPDGAPAPDFAQIRDDAVAAYEAGQNFDLDPYLTAF